MSSYIYTHFVPIEGMHGIALCNHKSLTIIVGDNRILTVVSADKGPYSLIASLWRLVFSW